MKKKSETPKEGLVCTCINDLLLTKSEFITTGVPQQVLELKVVDELSSNSSESNTEKLREKAKSLIANEVKNESLVRASSGNYFHGPRVNQTSAQDVNQSIKGDSSEPRKTVATDDESELAQSMDEDDDEEEEEEDEGEVEQEANSRQKKDEDYQPQGYSKIVSNPSRSEGRVSSRMKKSRFDSDEYVFPSILKKFNKTISRRPDSPPISQDKPVRKKRGPKPKSTGSVCAICRNVALASALLATCKNCSVKAHMFCTEKEMNGTPISDWCCKGCKLRTPNQWKCTVCHNPAGKEFGVLVSCESCTTKYHRPCHTPTIETKLKSWKCAKCSPSKCEEYKWKRALDKTDTSDDQSSNQPTPKRLSFPSTSRCSNCKEKFTNMTDKLSCIVCKNSFHSGCCRVRDVPNIARLGARKFKWRCDSCKMTKGNYFVKKRSKTKIEVPSDDSINSNDDSMNLDLNEDVKVKIEDDNAAWWKTRLRPIALGKEQPPLGPIPDLSVPDVSKWSCVEVENYFNEHFIEKRIGQVFIDQDIDGKALKLMRRSDVVSVFNSSGFKLDIVLDVLQHVKRLQLRVNDRRYIWADVF